MKKLLLPNLIRICVDSYTPDAVEGRVYNPTSEEPIAFWDWGKLMVDVDYMFDCIGYPQAFQNKRTFNKEKESYSYNYKPEAKVSEKWFFNQEGAFATYNVYILSRQFSSWQGDICDKENEMIGHFSDALELLDILLKNMGNKEVD